MKHQKDLIADNVRKVLRKADADRVIGMAAAEPGLVRALKAHSKGGTFTAYARVPLPPPPDFVCSPAGLALAKAQAMTVDGSFERLWVWKRSAEEMLIELRKQGFDVKVTK